MNTVEIRETSLGRTNTGEYVLHKDGITIYFDAYRDDCGRYYRLFNKGVLIASVRFRLLFDELVEKYNKENNTSLCIDPEIVL